MRKNETEAPPSKSDSGLDRASKLVTVVGETTKVVGVLLLVGGCVTAVADPEWAKKKLDGWGISVSSFEIGPVKVSLKEASREGLEATKAIAAAQRALLDAQLLAQGLPSAEGVLTRISDARKQLGASLNAAETQAAALRDVGSKVGLAPAVPADGWVYVGLVNGDGSKALLSPSISPAGLPKDLREAGQVRLQHDAVLATDRVSCEVQRLEDVAPPTAADLERPMAVLRGGEGSGPLGVVESQICATRSGVQQLWVKVKVLPANIRFASLVELKSKKDGV